MLGERVLKNQLTPLFWKSGDWQSFKNLNQFTEWIKTWKRLTIGNSKQWSSRAIMSRFYWNGTQTLWKCKSDFRQRRRDNFISVQYLSGGSWLLNVGRTFDFKLPLDLKWHYSMTLQVGMWFEMEHVSDWTGAVTLTKNYKSDPDLKWPEWLRYKYESTL